MEYLFQLANKLSFAGIKVSFYKGSASVLKTINMSAKYADDELKNSKSIMSDATMVVRQKSTIDSKKLQRVANTVTSIADNFQNNNLGLAIKRCLNNNIIFVAPENICARAARWRGRR